LKYLLDSNTYITAKNFYYGMDFCPAYWDWLDQQFSLGIVASIDMIGKELKAGNDELAKWVKERPHHFIANDDEETQILFAEIIGFVMAGDYSAASRDAFLDKGDPWIIAKAKAIGATVVTHEALLPPNTTRVKIPNVCKKFEVPCMNTFQFLRELSAKFVLS